SRSSKRSLEWSTPSPAPLALMVVVCVFVTDKVELSVVVLVYPASSPNAPEPTLMPTVLLPLNECVSDTFGPRELSAPYSTEPEPPHVADDVPVHPGGA